MSTSLIYTISYLRLIVNKLILLMHSASVLLKDNARLTGKQATDVKAKSMLCFLQADKM